MTDTTNTSETVSDNKPVVKKVGMPWWGWLLIVLAVLFVLIPTIFGFIAMNFISKGLKESGVDLKQIAQEAKTGRNDSEKAQAIFNGIANGLEKKVQDEAAKDGKKADVDLNGLFGGDVKIPEGFPSDIMLPPSNMGPKLVMAVKNTDPKTGKQEYSLSYTGTKGVMQTMYDATKANLQAAKWTLTDETGMGVFNTIQATKDGKEFTMAIVGGESKEGSNYIATIAVTVK